MDEVKDAVLAMLVERFDGRMLTWQVATEGLALAAFEIKQAALWAQVRLAAGKVRRRERRPA